MTFSLHDKVPDSPTNTFATWNALNKNSGVTISDGNTEYSNTSNSNKDVSSTINIPPTTGLWYVEFLQVTGLSGNAVFGFGSPTYNYINGSNLVGNGNFIGYTYAGRKWSFGTQTNNLTTLTVNVDVLTFCIDASAGKAWAGKNGVWFSSGDPSTGANPFYTFTAGTEFVTAMPIYNSTGYVNFGQDPTFGGNKSPSSTYSDANGIGSFYYQPPTGALALCTANLPDPAIDPKVDDLPEDYMRAVDYIGNTSNDREISVNFPVDLVWIKNRDAAAGHILADTVRGAGKLLHSNATVDESSFTSSWKSSYGDVTGFTQNGFKVNTGTNTNGNGQKMIAWCFRAGGAPDLTSSPTKPFAKDNVQYETLSAAGITAGTITPTAMSVNTKAGFSIFKVTKSAAQYSYDTYPHGLSKAPDFIITKALNSSTEHWYCYHSSITPNTGYSARIQLNQTTQATLNSSAWGTPTNITDNIIAWDGAQNLEQIFYCWHSVAGYSAFGSYTGNGSTDGPFVYTGFKPAWIMCKSIDVTGNNWVIRDSVREGYNPNNLALFANTTDTETGSTWNPIDILSNGFKIRATGTDVNSTSETYIYAAFAEMPTKYATAR